MISYSEAAARWMNLLLGAVVATVLAGFGAPALLAGGVGLAVIFWPQGDGE